MTNPQAYGHYSKHSYVTEVRNASCWRCMWPYVNFILFTCSTGRQGMTGATRGRGEESVDSEGFAGQWWSIPCSGATINYVTANGQATKGFPKIGGSCPRPENKWPKSQRGRTVFLTCGHYRDARSAEMKHDVLGLEAGSGYSIKTLKCTGMSMCPTPGGQTVDKEGKVQWTMACWLPESNEPAFGERETSVVFPSRHRRS